MKENISLIIWKMHFTFSNFTCLKSYNPSVYTVTSLSLHIFLILLVATANIAHFLKDLIPQNDGLK